MKKTIIIIIAGFILLILLIIPTIIYCTHFAEGAKLSNSKSDWGAFGDYFGGLLNPLLGIMTLCATVYIATTFNAYEKRRDTQSKKESDVKAYLELYQYFTGIEFREKRHTAWNVIRKAIENEEYKNFLVKETFVSRYINRKDRKDVFVQFRTTLYNDQIKMQQKEFLRNESDDRHKLDSVINFFQLLAIKDVPEGYYSICDFYYDSWRPLLYWYAREIENGYELLEINKKYNNPPTLKSALELLDGKYYKPTIKDDLTYDTIDQHPILNWYINEKKNK